MTNSNEGTARTVVALIRRQTGKQFTTLEKELPTLSIHALEDFVRLLRDLDSDKITAVRNAKLTPWR